MIQGWDQTRALLFPSKAFCSLGLSPPLCIMGQYQLLRLLMYSSECHCTVPLLLSPYLGVTLVFGAPGLAPAFLGAPPTQRRSRLACGVSRGLKVPACLPKSVITSSLINAQARANVGSDRMAPPGVKGWDVCLFLPVLSEKMFSLAVVATGLTSVNLPGYGHPLRNPSPPISLFKPHPMPLTSPLPHTVRGSKSGPQGELAHQTDRLGGP